MERCWGGHCGRPLYAQPDHLLQSFGTGVPGKSSKLEKTAEELETEKIKQNNYRCHSQSPSRKMENQLIQSIKGQVCQPMKPKTFNQLIQEIF